MRKILIFMVCVALVASLAVPTFAASSPYFAEGKYLFNEELNFGTQPVETEFSLSPFTYLDTEYDTIAISHNVHDDGGTLTLITFSDSQSIAWTMLSFEDGVSQRSYWDEPYYRTIDFGDGQLIPGLLSDMLHDHTVPICDGTSCPATEADDAGICVDCGRVLMRSVAPAPPDPYSVWTEAKQETFPYALIYQNNNGDYTFIMSAHPAVVTDGALTFATGSHVRYSVFGSSWNLVSSYDEYTTYGNIAEVYPSYNIRNEAGSIVYPYNSDFFPIPLWEQMEMVTQGEVTQMSGVVASAMTTLTLCGVGLLALLMVLVLFGKRSQIFHL